MFGAPVPRLDYPAAGQLLFALGAWALLREPARRASVRQACDGRVALRLLALADRFAYNRTMPTMMWERIVAGGGGSGARAGRRVPGSSTGTASRPDLLAEACRLAERLPG